MLKMEKVSRVRALDLERERVPLGLSITGPQACQSHGCLARGDPDEIVAGRGGNGVESGWKARRFVGRGCRAIGQQRSCAAQLPSKLSVAAAAVIKPCERGIR